MADDMDLLFGKIALEKGFISFDQLQKSIQAAAQLPGRDLKSVMMEKGFLTQRQAQHLHRILLTQSQGGEDQVGDYRLLDQIGEGGMGAVYKSLHIPTRQVRALKILNQKLAQDFEYVQRFIREARTSAALDHPNIVRTFEAKKEGGYYYIAMEYIEGESLDKYLQKRGSLSEEEALTLCRQIAEALCKAHEKNIVHRDIKPENILLTREKQVKLTDFGLVKVVDNVDLTQTGYVVGTPTYVSPEQAMGHKEVDIRADIYSLGITLFHMVTGRVPYEDDNTAVVFQKQVQEPLPNPKKFNPNLSRGMVKLIKSMAAKKPFHRPANPENLIDRIDNLLSGGKTTEAFSGGTKFKTRFVEAPLSKRSPLLFYGSISFGLGIAIISLVWFLFFSPTKKEPPKKDPPSTPQTSKKNFSQVLSRYPALSQIGEAIQIYFAENPERAKEKLLQIPPTAGLESRRFSLALQGLMETEEIFQDSGKCLQINDEKTLQKLYQHLRSLEMLLEKWEDYPNFPLQWKPLRGEIRGAALLLESEFFRLQGKMASVLKKIEEYEKYQERIFWKKTHLATGKRKRVYNLYQQITSFFGLTQKISPDERKNRLGQYRDDLWKALIELGQDRKISDFEETELKQNKAFLETIWRGSLKKHAQGKLANKSLCEILFLMIANETILDSLPPLTPNEIQKTLEWVSTSTFHPPLGMDRLVINRWMLISLDFHWHLVVQALQEWQKNSSFSKAMFQSYLSTLLLNLPAYRAGEGDPGFFHHFFCVISGDQWKKALGVLDSKIQETNSTQKIDFAFGLPQNSFFFYSKRGDLINQSRRGRRRRSGWPEMFGPPQSYHLPMMQIFPGKVQKITWYFRPYSNTEFTFLLDQNLAFRVRRKENIFTGGAWSKGPLHKRALFNTDPPQRFSPITRDHRRIFISLEKDQGEWKIYLGTWKYLREIKSQHIIREDPSLINEKILWAKGKTSPLPSKNPYEVAQIFFKNAKLYFVSFSCQYTPQDLSRCLHEGMEKIGKYMD